MSSKIVSVITFSRSSSALMLLGLNHGYTSAHTVADIEETLNVMDDAAAELA